MQTSSSLIKQMLTNDNNFKSINNDLIDEMVDEVVLGICFEVHRAAKYGYLFLDESPPDQTNKYSIIDKKGHDIFGQVPMKKQHECVCPNCQRNLAASRFAPHLEKCMGMGRNSSRIASRRIANTSVKNNESDGEEYDNNADTDWNYYCNADSKKSKRKREKNGNGNNGNGNGVSFASNSSNNVHKKSHNSKNSKSGLGSKNSGNNIKLQSGGNNV